MTVRWSVVARIAAAAAAVALGVWWWTDYQRGDDPDIASLASDVRASMQHKLSTDPNFTPLDLTVHDVTLVKAGGNTYQGLADVSSRDGRGLRQDVPVTVTYDGDNLIWNTAPGAFLTFIQEPAPGMAS